MKVTALIPAYNEEKTIKKVLRAIQKHNKVNDILVIDDGSSDRTALVAKETGARVISFENNQGKGAALQCGINEIQSDIILMLDGDLIGLKEKHINTLLDPVFNNECDMTVGVFNDGRGLTDLAQFVAPNLSGQRAVKTEMIKNISCLKNSGYGVEIAINKYFKRIGKLKYVDLLDITHVMKEEKRGFARGLADRAKMYWDILKVTFRKTNVS
ncbi:MAG: glycosyltransferase family 2 protein [Halanaerobiales bacterium]